MVCVTDLWFNATSGSRRDFSFTACTNHNYLLYFEDKAFFIRSPSLENESVSKDGNCINFCYRFLRTGTRYWQTDFCTVFPNVFCISRFKPNWLDFSKNDQFLLRMLGKTLMRFFSENLSSWNHIRVEYFSLLLILLMPTYLFDKWAFDQQSCMFETLSVWMILHIFVRSLFETRSFAKCIEFPKVLLTQGQIQIHYDLQRSLTGGNHLIQV